MAVLKAKSTLLVNGKVVKIGQVFEVPDTLEKMYIERGYAEGIKEAEVSTPPQIPNTEKPVEPKSGETDEVEEMRKEYEEMNLPELKELAKANEVSIKGLSKKAEIIDALIQFELKGE